MLGDRKQKAWIGLEGWQRKSLRLRQSGYVSAVQPSFGSPGAK